MKTVCYARSWQILNESDKASPFNPTKYRGFAVVRQRQRKPTEREKPYGLHNAAFDLLYRESAKVDLFGLPFPVALYMYNSIGCGGMITVVNLFRQYFHFSLRLHMQI